MFRSSRSARVECQLRSLSDVLKEQELPRIDLLKNDSEGAEIEILLGIATSDWPKLGSVVVEVNDRNGRLRSINEPLRQHGLPDQVVALPHPESAPEWDDPLKIFGGSRVACHLWILSLVAATRRRSSSEK